MRGTSPTAMYVHSASGYDAPLTGAVCAPNPEDISVGGQIDRTGEALAYLQDRLDRLAGRICPVLRDGEPTAGRSPAASVGSGLASRVQSLAITAFELADRLDDLGTRVDL